MKNITMKKIPLLLAIASFGIASNVIAQTSITVGGYPPVIPMIYPPTTYQQPQAPNPQVTQLQTQNAENAKKVADLTAKLKDSSEKPADTASAQGYVDANAELKKAAAAEDIAGDNTPRQKGEVVSQPGYGQAVLNTGSLTIWFENWSLVLNGYGIPQRKIDFEGNRLSKDEFNDWANKQILASTRQATPQNVYVTDPQPHDGDVIPTYKK